MNEPYKLRSSRAQVQDTPEAIMDFLEAQGWTDGLPVIPPTEDRVAAFVAATGRRSDASLGTVPPLAGEATVEKVAVNAVMAGCRPEYMPIVIAAVKGTLHPEFNLNAIQTTTNPAAVMIVVNGPIRKRIGLNCSSGVMGPGWRANATIGRAMRLVQLNIGGASPGPVDKATQGSPGKYTFCIGENEEQSPWEPLHMERGFRAHDSVATVVAVQGTSNILEPSPRPEDTLTSLVNGATDPTCNDFLMGKGGPGYLLCPMHAELVSRIAKTKAGLKGHLHANVRFPYARLSKQVQERIAGQTDRIAEGMVAMTRTPDQWLVVVTGGEAGNHSTFAPTFGDSVAVSELIEQSRHDK